MTNGTCVESRTMAKQSNTVSSWIRGNCIGKGSFGAVHTAFHNLTASTFAVKSVLLTPGCGHNHVQLQSLENEIRIFRSLPPSPYIIAFLGDDVSYESSIRYRNLHLEYLPGGTVADLASRSGAHVDEKIVRSHTYCIVSALRHLHSQGIVHCDVKGRNVLVGPHPSSAKLADFGSATEISGDASAIFPRGSPFWMAPEVIRGESQGPKSDVWSLGCTVIEMVTGKPAWEDRGVDTLSRIGFSDELPEFPTQLSELARDFVDKCLRRDPYQRWSCDQLLQHPFMCSASPDLMTESSPRCVLDWFNSDSDSEQDQSDGDFVAGMGSSSNCENRQDAKQRIGILGTTLGADWESDDWLVVRSYARCETSSGQEHGMIRADADSKEIREEIEERAVREFQNSDGNDSQCGHVRRSTSTCASGGACAAKRRLWLWQSRTVESAVGRREELVGSKFNDGSCNFIVFIMCLELFKYVFNALVIININSFTFLASN